MTGLTTDQQAAVDALVAANRISVVPADPLRASAFLAAAADRISQLPNLTSSAVAFDLAYDAAHDVGEALLAAYGYRTANGAGQHEALGRFLRSVIDAPPAVASAAADFDRLRRLRNQSHYAAARRSTADADHAATVAIALHALATSRGAGT